MKVNKFRIFSKIFKLNPLKGTKQENVEYYESNFENEKMEWILNEKEKISMIDLNLQKMNIIQT